MVNYVVILYKRITGMTEFCGIERQWSMLMMSVPIFSFIHLLFIVKFVEFLV